MRPKKTRLGSLKGFFKRRRRRNRSAALFSSISLSIFSLLALCLPHSLNAGEKTVYGSYNAETAAPKPAHRAITPPPDITRGSTSGMQVSMTFDGGFEADDADAILDALKERGVKTTVFLTGQFIAANPRVVRRIVRDGHEVGNHTMNHPHLTDYPSTMRQRTLPWVTRELVIRELKEAERAFKAATGAEMAPLWRAPYGEVNKEIRAWAYEAGYIHIGWTNDGPKASLDTLDWVSDPSSRLYRTTKEIRRRLLNYHNRFGMSGGIVLMHLSAGRKTDKLSSSLGNILDDLMGRGYRLVKVSEMMEEDDMGFWPITPERRRLGAEAIDDGAGRTGEKTSSLPSSPAS